MSGFRLIESGAQGVPIGGSIQPVALQTHLVADKANITFGGMVAVVATGTTPPAVTLTGVPAATVQSFEMTCSVLGILGTSHVKILINGVSVYAGVSAASLGPFSGITVAIAAGAMAVNDVWTSVPSVLQWTSSEGAGYVIAQATQTAQPAWIAPGLALPGFTAGPNGQASVLFDGISQYLSDATHPTVAQPFTLFVLAMMGAPASGLGFFLGDGSSDVLGYVSTNGEIIYSSNSGANNGALLYMIQTDPFLASCVMSGTSSRFPANAGIKCNLGTLAKAAGLLVGAAGGAYFPGYISEISLHSAALSNAQANAETNYYATKYAL